MKETEYQLSSSVNDGIIEVIETGEITESSFKKLIDKVTALIKAHGVKKLLVDIRALKGRFGITETYERVRNYPPEFYGIHISIVDISDHVDFQRFHETTSLNPGLKFKWANDIDAARTWLKSK